MYIYIYIHIEREGTWSHTGARARRAAGELGDSKNTAKPQTKIQRIRSLSHTGP